MSPLATYAAEQSATPAPAGYGLSWFVPHQALDGPGISVVPAIFVHAHDKPIYAVDLYGDGLVFWRVSSALVVKSKAAQSASITLSIAEVERIVSRVSLGPLAPATHVRVLHDAILLESAESNTQEDVPTDAPSVHSLQHGFVMEQRRSTKRLKGAALQARLPSRTQAPSRASP